MCKGWVTYWFSYAKRHNDAPGGENITNDVLKFRRIIEFQSSWTILKCQWIAHSYTKSTLFASSYSPYTQVNSLKKSSFCAVFSSKVKHKRQKNAHTSNNQVIIFSDNFKYPVISKITVFCDVILTDNLQNLRFYERSPKNMNQKMFCTKSKLLTQKKAH